MKNSVKSIEINEEYLKSHRAIPFTLNKATTKETGKEIYSWNTVPRFFPEEMKASPVRIKYLMDHVKQVGLDDLAMPDQPKEEDLVEECHEITLEEVKKYYLSETYQKQGTIWNIPKNYTSIFMTKDTHDKIVEEFGRSISLVYPAADCAVVRFYDPKKDVIGITHSDAGRTTNNIIGKSIDYMKNHFHSNLNHIKVFVGAFAKEGWTYDKIPDFAAKKDEEGNGIGINEQWSNYIKETKGNYLINYGDKIYDQIKESGIEEDNIFFDPDNTLFHDQYFSNSRSFHSKVNGVPTYKEGRNLMGITFDTEKVIKKSEKNHTILR